jgi:hypothetical protein
VLRVRCRRRLLLPRPPVRPLEPSARTLDDLCRSGGTVATFRAGLSGQTHQWTMRSPSGDVLAQTFRVHRGGPIRQTLWKLWNMANMHVGDDIHVELRGADGVVLVKVSSDNDTPAVVTVRDESDAQVAKMVRAKATLTVFGRDDRPAATLNCEDDSPWQATDADGRPLGELLAGKPDPSRKPGLVEWTLFTDIALDRVARQQGQHLGIRKVVRYSYAPLVSGPMPAALALLPLLAGVVY